MSRALDLTLEPRAHAEHRLRLNVYTYGYDVKYASLRETVYFEATCGFMRLTSDLTADEARVLANQLLQVADQADENKARRESLEDFEEDLRDPNFDARNVHFVHPDVVDAEPGRMAEACAANPGKLVIGLQHDDEGAYQGGVSMASGGGAAASAQVITLDAPDQIIFVEKLPRGWGEVVREALHQRADGADPVDDASGFQTAHDAVVDAQALGARLLMHVQPDHLTFIFSHLQHVLTHVQLGLPAAPAPGQPAANMGQQAEHAGQQGQAKPRAVVLCKLRNAQALQDLLGAEQQGSEEPADSCKLCWADLQRVQQRLDPVGGHGAASVANSGVAQGGLNEVAAS